MLSNQTLGGYQITEMLGQGGMAQVYKAYQPRLERWVAVKVLTAQFAGDSQFLARFRREARALSVLRHPNILTVYDYGEENGVPYIVTEYVSGGTLRTRLEQGKPYTWPGAAALIIPVCQALAYAHEQGVFHRDVKPANILMPREDWPLLADFGLVKLVETSERLTQLGDSLGTPEYMSPEQGTGDEIDHRADIYTVGVVLYELLSNVKPFAGGSAFDIILRHLQEPPRSPRAHNADIPEPVAALVLKAMAKRPEERFQSMGEMVAALEDELERFASAARPGAQQPETVETPLLAGARSATPVTGSEPVLLGACASCGAEINLMRAYCSHCGAPVPNQRKASAIRLRAAQGPSTGGESAVEAEFAAQVSPATMRFADHTESLGGPRLVLETGVELIIPPKVEVLIGRADARNKRFPDIDLAPHNAGGLGVSRDHARLILKGEQWYLEDLNSTNGTFVDRERVAPGMPVRLAAGCEIWCGRLVMTFKDR